MVQHEMREGTILMRLRKESPMGLNVNTMCRLERTLSKNLLYMLSGVISIFCFSINACCCIWNKWGLHCIMHVVCCNGEHYGHSKKRWKTETIVAFFPINTWKEIIHSKRARFSLRFLSGQLHESINCNIKIVPFWLFDFENFFLRSFSEFAVDYGYFWKTPFSTKIWGFLEINPNIYKIGKK